jgi:hypothetical protein
MASHGFNTFKANIELKGEGVKQVFEFDGSKCADHEDLARYMADIMAPKLQGVTPGEVKGLRDQVKKLEAELAKVNAEASAAKQVAEQSKKAVAATKKAYEKNDQ